MAITEHRTCMELQNVYFFKGPKGRFRSVLGLNDGGGVPVLYVSDMEFPVPIAAKVLILGEGTSPLGNGALKSVNCGFVSVAR